MEHLIEQMRTTVPLDGAEARIDAGKRLGLAELSQPIRTSRNIARVLEKAGLMQRPGIE